MSVNGLEWNRWIIALIFLIGGYNSDGSTRLYSLVEEDELLASIRGRIMKKIALINPPFRGVIHRIKDAYPFGVGIYKSILRK